MSLVNIIKSKVNGLLSKLDDEKDWEDTPKRSLTYKIQEAANNVEKIVKPIVINKVSKEMSEPAFKLFPDGPTRQDLLDNFKNIQNSPTYKNLSNTAKNVGDFAMKTNEFVRTAPDNAIKSLSKNFLYNPETKQAFPSSPYYRFRDINSNPEMQAMARKEISYKDLSPETKKSLYDFSDIFVSGLTGNVGSVGSPIKTITKEASEGNNLIKTAASNLDEALKEKMRYLVRGVDDLVKGKGMNPAEAAKVNFTKYKELFKQPGVVKSADDFISSLGPIPAKQRVNIIDYWRTPDKVLAKIGLKNQSEFLRSQYDNYLKELPEEINKVSNWYKKLGPDGDERVFRWLDGEAIALTPSEQQIGFEMKSYLKDWAKKLGLPEDKQITNYITHIFEDSGEWAELDPEVAKMMRNKVSGSVYDPFLQKRSGDGGNYIHSAARALDAYVKRGVRKYNLDPALQQIKNAANGLEESQFNYIKNYVDNINLKPTELDNLVDNMIKSSPIGFKFGPRPTNVLTKQARKMTYRGLLGLNVKTALNNLTQGANTYAELGEKYTVIGYSKVAQNLGKFLRNAPTELDEMGVLGQDMLQDRTLSAAKRLWQNIDEGLYYLFNQAEKINRGAAYWGAKSKYLAEGMDEVQAIAKAKELVRKTQFTFGSIDTPVSLQSDIMKTLFQFQSFGIKQGEYLIDKVLQKDIAGLVRWTASSMLMVGTIGKLWGMEPSDLIPSVRIGTPPSLQLPAGAIQAATQSEDAYGNKLSLKDRVLNSNLTKGAINYIPGGAQARKTIMGAQAINEGGVYSKSGKLRFPVEPGLSPLVFGPNVSETAKEYYDSGSVMGDKQTSRYKSLIDSGIEPNRAYEMIKTDEPEQGVFQRISNAVSGLFSNDKNEVRVGEQSTLTKAYLSEIEKDKKASEIRELYKLGLSDEELKQSLSEMEITKDEADTVIMKALSVETGSRGEFIKSVLSGLKGDEYKSAFVKLVDAGVLTTSVINQWEKDGVISENQANSMTSMLKRANGSASAGTSKKKFAINIPGSLNLPNVKASSKFDFPTLKAIEPIKAKRPEIKLPNYERIPVRDFSANFSKPKTRLEQL